MAQVIAAMDRNVVPATWIVAEEAMGLWRGDLSWDIHIHPGGCSMAYVSELADEEASVGAADQ